MINNYDFRGFNYLEEYYMNDLEGYYSSLQMELPPVCYDGRLNPPHLEIWVEYFIRIMSINAEQIYELASKASKEEAPHFETKNLEKKDLMLLKFMFENNRTEIKPKDLAGLFNVTSRAIIKWCDKWVEKGILCANRSGEYITSYSLTKKYLKMNIKDLGFIE